MDFPEFEAPLNHALEGAGGPGAASGCGRLNPLASEYRADQSEKKARKERAKEAKVRRRQLRRRPSGAV